MSTVLVDRYRVQCRRCGLDEDFIVGAGLGDLRAVSRGEIIHGQHAADRECDGTHQDLTISITQKAPR